MGKVTDPALVAQLNAGAGPSGFTPLTAPNPNLPLDRAYKQNQIRGQDADLGMKPLEEAKLRAEAAKAAADAARAPFQSREAAANAAKAEMEAAKLAGHPTPQSPQQQAETALNTDEVMQAIDQARQLVNAGMSTGFASQILGKLGGTGAVDLNGTLNTIKGNLTLKNLKALKSASATGASGMGSLTEKEGELLASTVASLDQRQSKDKLLDSLAKIENHYRRWSALNDGHDPSDPAVAKHYGIVSAAPPAAGGDGRGSAGPGAPPPTDPMGLSRSTKTVIDPTLAGVNQKVAALIKSGAGEADVRQYLDTIQPGLGAKAENIGAWVQFHNQHPNQPINVMLDRTEVPLSPIAGAVNAAAQSPYGAAVMSAADQATFGLADNMTGNPALARAGMAAVQKEHPYASMTGAVIGAAPPALGIEGVLGKLGMKAGQGMFAARPMLADALYGSGYGAGANDDNRLGGAAAGGVAGAVGGIFGRGAINALGSTATGVTDIGKKYLANARIPMTVGQMAGGAAKGIEDRLSGMPIIGDAINARRTQGLNAFNKAAFRETLDPIGQSATGQIGEAGVNNADDAISDAYRAALGGTQVRTDLPYKMAMATLPAQVGSIPRVGPELTSAIDKTVSPMFQPGGTLTGEDMHATLRGLQQLRAAYKQDPLFATDIAPAIDAVSGHLRGLFERQQPDVIPGLDKANAAFRNFATTRDAVNKGLNTDGIFTPAQLGMAARQNTVNFGGKTAAASGNRPFFDLQRAAQNVLPSKIPDSGTAGRLVLPLLAGAAGGGADYAGTDGKDRSLSDSAGKALAFSLLAAAPYSKVGQDALSALFMAGRPKPVVDLGEFAKRNARIGGMFGNPLALQYYATPPQ